MTGPDAQDSARSPVIRDALQARFDQALFHATGPRHGLPGRFARVYFIGVFVRSAYQLFFARSRFFAVRCMAQVGFSNLELARYLLTFPALAGFLWLFVTSDTIRLYASGMVGPVQAAAVQALLVGLEMMTLVALIDCIAASLGTFAHARGKRILEKTNLSEIKGMGGNIFSPRR